jgi:hypothetical protein
VKGIVEQHGGTVDVSSPLLAAEFVALAAVLGAAELTLSTSRYA